MKKNMDSNNKIKGTKKFETKEVVFLVVITCVVSIMMGWIICSNTKSDKINDKNLQSFIQTYKTVKRDYYGKVTNKELIDYAINGMLNGLGDDYTSMIGNDDSSNFNALINGEYEGVGLLIGNKNKDLIVLQVFENSPAEKAGIKVGDIIEKIDNYELKNKDTSELTNYIKKHDNSKYEIYIKRNNETKKIEVNKTTVVLKSVSSKIYTENDQKIGYIYLSIFSKNAYSQFKEKLTQLEKQKINSLIIDLRDNGGGQLTSATKILSLFLDYKTVIYQTEKKDVKVKFYAKGKNKKTYPLVILQNKESASASEMVSSALQEQYKAKIVGTNSYGKGTIQDLVTLKDGTEYKYTSKKWLTSKGKWINKVGVTPDVKIELSDDYKDNPTETNDNQLQKAIELLKGE